MEHRSDASGVAFLSSRLRSSAGQSKSLLMTRSQVRVLPGAPVSGTRSCDLCARALRVGEPVYPVTFAPEESANVCVACAHNLSREGIGAWAALGTDAQRRR